MTKMHHKHFIKIERMTFHTLIITHTTCLNLDGPSQIQQTQLNHNNLKCGVSSEPLIEELNLDATVMPDLPYKLRYSSTLKIILRFSEKSNYLATKILESHASNHF